MAVVEAADVYDLVKQFRVGTPPELPPHWWDNAHIIAAHQQLARDCLATIPPYPDDHAGQGIVVCGGGHVLFINAWVCIRMLRHWGCSLPIQLWHLGECELDDAMRRLVAPYGVECVDAEALAVQHPVRRLAGWELKAYALLHCPFRQVLLLDADNVPLTDPAFLFATPEFADHGALFWPDYGRLDAGRKIWPICEVAYRDEPEFESGQIAVDRQRCWPALTLALHYNAHSDFYYHHVHGDKETFHLAFHRVGKSYAMPSRPIHPLRKTMCQHDFAGERLFQHRNLAKWRFDGGDVHIAGFRHEDLCRGFLAELRNQWSGRVQWNEPPTAAESAAIQHWGGRAYRYTRVGFDERPLELRSDRTVGAGAAANERWWTISLQGEEPTLLLLGDRQPTCRLRYAEGAWRGRWFRHEQMPVVLEPL